MSCDFSFIELASIDLGAGLRGGVRGGMNAESYAERGGQGKDKGLIFAADLRSGADKHISLERKQKASGGDKVGANPTLNRRWRGSDSVQAQSACAAGVAGQRYEEWR